MTDTILRKTDVEKIAGLSERQIRRLEEQGHFPKRVALSPSGRAVGWKASEVQAWVASREAA